MMALLVRVDNLEDRTSNSFSFTKSPVRIGRNPLNDLPLEWPFVSQWHAVVQFDDSNTVYYDLGSTNGTLVNGQRLTKNVPMPVRDQNIDIRIGSVRLTFARAQLPAGMSVRGTGSVTDSVDYERTMIAEGFPRPGAPGGDGQLSTMMLEPSGRPGVAPAVAVGGAVRGRVQQLRPLYLAYRQAWVALYQGLADVLNATPAHQYGAVLALFVELFPEVASEPQLVELAQSQRVPLAGPGALGSVALQMVHQLAQHLVPSRQPPATSEEVEGFLVRVAAAMNAFGTAFVGLNKGHNEFKRDRIGGGPRRGGQGSPIEEANDPRQVIDYLLDWTAQGEVRTEELRGAYAEIMIHQMALLSGVMESVRSLLARMSPEAIAREVSEKGGLRFWPFRAGAYWRRYTAKHHDLVSEDREITEAIFGKQFAQIYNSVVGENFADGELKRIGNSGGR